MKRLWLKLLQDKAHKEPTDDAFQIFTLAVTIEFVPQLLVVQEKSAGKYMTQHILGGMMQQFVCLKDSFDVQQAILPS